MSRFLLGWIVLLALASTTVFAQAPKPGDWYEETSDLGFKVKVPDGWEYIPPAPDEGNMIGLYEPKVPKYINLGGSEILFINCWLLTFDRRESAAEAQKRKRTSPDVKAWIERNSLTMGTQFREVERKETAVDKVPAVELLYEGKSSSNVTSGKGGVPIYVYAMVYKVEPDVDFALVFNAPAEKKDWAKWKGPITSMAKSFKRMEVKNRLTGEASGVGSGSLRGKKRARLEAEVAKSPGWQLYETPNYFILSNNPDGAFIEELQRRLEGIRAVYEVDYPVEKALAARRNGPGEGGEDKGPGNPQDDGDLPEGEAGRTKAERADPMEQSRTSVVRVCLNEDQYKSYGGPPNSAGYWNSRDEELVVYDDKAGGGRGDTWSTLNHEAFHQYIFYFYGNIAPHSWYNEGTGDYYAGYQINGRGKFELERFDWRLRTIQQNIREEKYCPLNELVRWSQQQYYGQNDYGLDGSANYAQGWAFVYFLRTGKKNKAKGWNPAWDSILDTYLDTLAATGDLDQSVDKAFAGVDFAALETAWKAYTLK